MILDTRIILSIIAALVVTESAIASDPATREGGITTHAAENTQTANNTHEHHSKEIIHDGFAISQGTGAYEHVIEVQTAGGSKSSLGGDVSHKKIIIARDLASAGAGDEKRSIRVIRAGTPGDVDTATGAELLADERLMSQLPVEIQETIRQALREEMSDEGDLRISDIDVIVGGDGQPGWYLQGHLPGIPRPHHGRMAHKKAPLPPLTQKAAECVLKTITKVNTESATQLLREACAGAFP